MQAYFLLVTLFNIVTNAHISSITANMPTIPFSMSSRDGSSVSGAQENDIALSKSFVVWFLLYKNYIRFKALLL